MDGEAKVERICNFAKIKKQARIFVELRMEKNTNPNHSSSGVYFSLLSYKKEN